MLIKKQVAASVWAIYGDTQEEIGKAFIRFQEYYENNTLKGRKDITVPMIEEWWATECLDYAEEDREPYYTFWQGFNIPGKVLLALMSTSEFRSGFSMSKLFADPKHYPRWHPQEDQLIDLLQDLTVDQINDGYFIGLSKDSDDVFDHELAHALFATNRAYQAAQVVNLSKLPPAIYQEMRTDLLNSGYHTSVINDEMQAYLSTYPETLHETFDKDEYTPYTTPFVATFQECVAAVNDDLVSRQTVIYRPVAKIVDP
jgi:hypothetical protein